MATRQDVDRYLQEIGLKKVSNVENILDQVVGTERRKEIISAWDQYDGRRNKIESESIQPSDLMDDANFEASTSLYDQTEIYNILNANFDIARAIACFSDAEIVKHFGYWIASIISYIRGNVLEVGCGDGFLSCMIARMCPFAEIYAIDRSEKAIAVANELKNRLGLKNITFEYQAIEDLPDQKYDVVLSFRTMHENIGHKYFNARYLRFDKQILYYKKLYAKYIEKLSSKLSDRGHLIAIERNMFDIDLLGLLLDINDNGCTIDMDGITQIRCLETNHDIETEFTAIIAEKYQDQTASNIFAKWAEKVFKSPHQFRYENEYADYFLMTMATGIRSGYEGIDKQHTICGIQVVYRCEYESIMLFYQANKNQKYVTIYLSSRYPEAQELLAGYKQNNTASDFEMQNVSEDDFDDSPIALSIFGEIEKKERFDIYVLLHGLPGRNDTCPCGSGKKYKNCCGKCDS